jgi:hypothetical protein
MILICDVYHVGTYRQTLDRVLISNLWKIPLLVNNQ